jgi:hypothetical protein
MSSTNPEIYHRLTELRAYKLWEEAGKPENRSDEFWFRAEKQIVPRYGKYRWVESESGMPYLSNVYLGDES